MPELIDGDYAPPPPTPPPEEIGGVSVSQAIRIATNYGLTRPTPAGTTPTQPQSAPQNSPALPHPRQPTRAIRNAVPRLSGLAGDRSQTAGAPHPIQPQRAHRPLFSPDTSFDAHTVHPPSQAHPTAALSDRILPERVITEAEPALANAPRMVRPPAHPKARQAVLPTHRMVSEAGIHAIEHFEGWVPHPYSDDPADPALGYATIGYGHALHKGPVTSADVRRWGIITRAEGQRLLRHDIATAVRAVKALVKVPVTQSQFDALVSFTYNVGTTGLRKSAALQDLNARRYGRVPGDFLHFDRDNPGLQSRHRAEGAMFAHGVYPGG